MIEIFKEKDIEDYSNLNKVFIPNDYYNTSYNYYFNGDYITIVTPYDCYTNYNTTYCRCHQYNYKNNVVSESYTCNSNPSNARISHENISTDINYSQSIKSSYMANIEVYLLMFVVALLFAKLLLKERSHL